MDTLGVRAIHPRPERRGFSRIPVKNIQVLQTFLWVSSTLSRTVCQEDVRWKAWSCTGNCLG
jgi:hypothetical protein